MAAADDLADLSRRALRLQTLDRILPSGSPKQLDALARVLRYAAGLLTAVEYELLELVAVSGNSVVPAPEQRDARLWEVARSARRHVDGAIKRADIAPAYQEVLVPWFASQSPAHVRPASAFFRAFVKQAPDAAARLAAWTADGATLLLEARGPRSRKRAQRVRARAETIRRSIVPGLRAMARVGMRIMDVNDHPIPPGAIKVAVPEVRQDTDWSCGAACLQAVCGYYGVGPEEEWEFSRDLGADRRIGVHPFQILRAARGYGLYTLELRDQTDVTNVRAALDLGRPVLLMIQAWGDPDKYQDDADYDGVWSEGHWVVAIGYEPSGFFFEDPSIAGARGYLSNGDLELRWRDTGPHNRYMPGYGIVLWRDVIAPAYFTRARRIG